MHILLFALMLQTPLPRARVPVPVPQLRESETSTAPNLNKSTPPQSQYEMGRDIGGLASTTGYLQADVDNLKKLREDPDRKDIESLLKTKETISIWLTAYLSILGTLGAFLWAFGMRIWQIGRAHV